MLGKKNGQQNFFDKEIFANMIPEDHPLVKIKRHVSFAFVEEAVKDLYDPENGRPSFPPETLFRVLFLEIWANLSDIQVCRELKYNVLYRWFCDIGWGGPIPDDTTLVVFRRRLGEEKFRELFSRLVEEAKKKGCLKGQWAIIDGTKVIANAAQRGVIVLLREARKKIHRELEKHRPELAKELSAQAEPLLENDFANQEELLAGEAIKTKIMAEAVKDVAGVSELVRQVEEILGGGQASLADPDARAGYQKKDDPFFGYKAVVTVNEKGLVEAVEVEPGNVKNRPDSKANWSSSRRWGSSIRGLRRTKGTTARATVNTRLDTA